MTTSLKYSRCYALLGAFPDDDWETLKKKYRRQIRRWHPDRYNDEHDRLLASEKTKELNTAFEALSGYFERHGTLPLVTAANPIAPAPTGVAGDSAAPAAEDGGGSGIGKRYVVFAGSLFAAFFYFLFVEPPEDTDDVPPELVPHDEYSPPRAGNDKVLLGEPPKSKRAGKNAGKTLSTGAYASALEPPAPATPPTAIRRGSTKEEVLALQGPPERESQAIWEYGASRIYFHHGRVIGWDEDPRHPLKLALPNRP